MKKLLIYFIPVLALIIFGCNNESGSGGVDPFGGGGAGGGTGNVTFTIGQRQGDQGGIMFTVKPSTAITVTQVIVSLPAQGFQDIIQDDGQTVYQAQTYDLAEYTGVASGQQWTFNFKGKIGNAQGQDYDVNSNYTIP